ncbi:hypothetical protein ACRRTK_010392 [Alexandromys fortis]
MRTRAHARRGWHGSDSEGPGLVADWLIQQTRLSRKCSVASAVALAAGAGAPGISPLLVPLPPRHAPPVPPRPGCSC